MELSYTLHDQKTILVGSKSLDECNIVSGMDLDITDTSDTSMANDLGAAFVASEATSGTLFQQGVEKYEAKSGDAGFAAFRKARSAPPAATDDTDKDAAGKFDVGARIITKKGAVGTVRFVGCVSSLPKGYWLGIELDEANGKNDGAVKGVRLFQCEANKGTVVRPSAASVLGN
jgi:hypothetical protein